MQIEIKEHIQKVLELSVVLERPKDISLGHYATPVAFSLSKVQKKSPMIIANELVQKFENTEVFKKIEAVNGFINFTLSDEFLLKQIDRALLDRKQFAKESKKNQKILLEYVSANPTGPLHIGHARGAILGDALYKIGNHLGYEMVSEYYINDAGSQMELLTTSLLLVVKEKLQNQKVEYPEKYYRGEYLLDIAKKISKKYGEEIFEDSSKLEEITKIAKDEVLELIKDDLKKLGIEFDNFVSEKSLYKSWDETRKILGKNGYLFDDEEGKVWLKSTEFGDDANRVVVRENGIPTYLAGDIIYHSDKFKREYDSYINIWGADHHGYIARVKAAIKFLGYEPDKLEIILSQMVLLLKNGEPYKVSKRAGNVVLLSDVVEDIGADALRFIFLTKKSDTHLEFDIEKLKNKDSTNPIFYINYAHARINQLFEKSEHSFDDINFTKILKFENDSSRDLAYEALLLPSVLDEAFKKRDVHKITDFLYSLASSVHRFYNEQKIIGSKDEKELLKVLAISKLSIKTGLKLLGIEAKKVM